MHRSNELEQRQHVVQAVSMISDSFDELCKLKPKKPKLEVVSKLLDAMQYSMQVPSAVLVLFGTCVTAYGLLDIALSAFRTSMDMDLDLSRGLSELGVGVGALLITFGLMSVSNSLNRYATEPKNHLRQKSPLARFVRFITPKRQKTEIVEYLKKKEIYDTEMVSFKELVQAKKEEFASEIEMVNSVFDDRKLFVADDGEVNMREFEKPMIAIPKNNPKEFFIEDTGDISQKYNKTKRKEPLR